MGKDPAFLFYPNDYLGGTLGMTFEEKGAYMELLMVQFNRGHMTSHMVGQVVGQIWDKIQDKFQIDDNGLYYNARLDAEVEKRKSFVVTRYNNLAGKNQYSKREGHLDGHMTSHMEDRNEDENINKVKPIILSKDKLIFDFSSFGNYTDMMIEWVEYKKSIKDSYKSQKSLVACFENLKKLSNDNVTTAKDIIMQSMANNWKGLFELKNKPKSALIGVGEFINADGNRTYGTSGVIVPNDAPPRPSNNHIWSKNEAKWKIQ